MKNFIQVGEDLIIKINKISSVKKDYVGTYDRDKLTNYFIIIKTDEETFKISFYNDRKKWNKEYDKILKILDWSSEEIEGE